MERAIERNDGGRGSERRAAPEALEQLVRPNALARLSMFAPPVMRAWGLLAKRMGALLERAC